MESFVEFESELYNCLIGFSGFCLARLMKAPMFFGDWFLSRLLIFGHLNYDECLSLM